MSRSRDLRRKATAKERRAADRVLARAERERRRRRARRWRVVRRTSAPVAALAVVVAVAVALHAQAQAAGTGPANMAADGVLLAGDGTATAAVRTHALAPGEEPTATVVDAAVPDVVLYVDYRDPQAAAFWAASGEQVESWVTMGYTTVEIHPVAVLDGTEVPAATATADPTSTATAAADATAAATPDARATDVPSAQATATATTGDYSARAAGALACVADVQPDAVLMAHAALLEQVGGLDADGLSTDELVAVVTTAIGADEDVEACVRGGDFVDWAQEATARAAEAVPYAEVGAVTTSPVVLVAGQPYTGDLGDADDFASFLSNAYSAALSTAEGTTGDATTDDGTTPEPTATP